MVASARRLTRSLIRRAPIIRVEVTRERIDDAIKQNSAHCMIGVSIEKDFPQYSHVSVDLATIRFSDREKGLRYTYLTPRVAQQALVLWDNGTRMRPFAFTLRGAHITARQMTKRDKDGKPIRKRVRLGRRRIVPESKGSHKVPQTIGGRPIPRLRRLIDGKTSPKGSGGSLRREFGMRAFTIAGLEE